VRIVESQVLSAFSQPVSAWQLVFSREMFATATNNFVQEVDHGGLLIPVSSLNDTIALLTVVVKRRRFWMWQKPRYTPTDFNFNDILTGDTPIKPGTHQHTLYAELCVFII